VSLSLSDVISNGIKKPKKGKYKIVIYMFTFFPPLAIIIFYPYIFITAIRFAGILVLFTLLFLPSIIVWKSRFMKNLKNAGTYQVFGGNFTVLLMVIFTVIMLIYSIMHL
jgi:tyrosine-specific transport protein